MKKFIIIILIMLSYFTDNDAQWYYRTCKVSDINNCTKEEFECLWENALKNFSGGVITTGIGITFTITGLIMVSVSEPRLEDLGTLIFGGFITYAGIILDCIGIPILITGAVRKEKLRNSPKFNELNLGSLNVSPSIGLNQLNNSHYLGISLFLTF